MTALALQTLKPAMRKGGGGGGPVSIGSSTSQCCNSR